MIKVGARRLTRVAAAAIAAPIAACSPASSPAPDSARQVRVIVFDCYTSDRDLVVEVDDRALDLVAAEKRNDSLGLCYDRAVSIGPKVGIFVHGVRGEYRRTLVDEPGRILLVNAAAPDHTGYADENRLGFD